MLLDRSRPGTPGTSLCTPCATPRRSLARRLAFAFALSVALAGGARAQNFASVAEGSGVSVQRATAPDAIAVSAVSMVGLTVSDMDRSLDFYTNVLSFEKVSDVEVTGEPYEYLQIGRAHV